ncbi:Alginate_exp domain-containing protein [Tenacibaculum sp. 190524A05c]|uniref:alginate export family protein n=1 Tax=Tenacibaculum platacis TaxID=3137852 RepID=UPI0031FA5A01
MKKYIVGIILMVLCSGYLNAQEFNVGLDIRPRLEYSHGFGNLIPEGVDPGLFVQQRSRLNLGYAIENFSTFFSVQDVSVWGDTPQISPNDGNNSFSLAQAWVRFNFDKNWTVKVGRQVLSYDDQRIFGGLDWAMQGRFHDAALVSYKQNGFQLDFGLSFNQNGVSRRGTLFDPNNAGDARAVFDYKSMIYVWANKKWKSFSGSFLFANNSYQNLAGQTPVEGTVNRQTFGVHLVSKPNNSFKILANLYAQTGEFFDNVDLSAYNAMLELNYKPNKTLFGLGFEILSGDDNGANDGEISSFFPIFGTNHKFNGFMDYFYVGNHANSVGLKDMYAKAVFKTGAKSSLLGKIHYFMSDQDIGAENYLGTEVDVVFTQKVMSFATLKIGYSHMFASDTMEVLKGVANPSSTQNWGWAMLIVKPTLFQKKNNDNKI